MDEATIPQNSFYASLQRLEQLAKGQAAQAPADPNVIVEKMNKGLPLTDAEQELVKAQICTGSGNEPQSWPGGDPTHYGEGWTDNIRPDGTDYNQRAGVRKSIMEKVAKGIPLTVEELALLKSDIDSGGIQPQGQPMDKGVQPEPEKEHPAMDKSMAAAAQQSQTLQKGFEVSEFLHELAKSFHEGLIGLEARTEARLQALAEHNTGTLQQFANQQGEFNKSLADAVVNIGHGLSGTIQQVEQVAQQPMAAPRSQMIARPQQVQQPMMKAQLFGGPLQQPMMVPQPQIPPGYQLSGPQPQFPPQQQQFMPRQFGGPMDPQQQLMMKSGPDEMVLGHMTEMCKSGNLNPLDVIKYEATGEIHPALLNQIQARMAGGGQ